LRIRRHLVRDAGIADLALCPNDPLCQRRRRREKGARYLFRGQAADLTQRKRDPGFESDRRGTAGKDKPKAIILEGVYVPLVTPGALDRARHLLDRFVEARASAYSVDCLEAAGRYEPGTRIPRKALLRPLLRRGHEGFLERILGKVEISQQPDEGGQNTARFPPIDLFHHVDRRRRAVHP